MENKQLIEVLHNCIAHCHYCADACLDENNLSKMVACIRTNKACIEICTATVNLLASQYSPVDYMIEQCHKICTACAQECEKHDHQHCKECAEACKACSDACLSYGN